MPSAHELPSRLPANRGSGAAVFAGFLGWTLDAFDYFLVVFCLTDIDANLARATSR